MIMPIKAQSLMLELSPRQRYTEKTQPELQPESNQPESNQPESNQPESPASVRCQPAVKADDCSAGGR